MTQSSFFVTDEQQGERLDTAVGILLTISRSKASTLIKSGSIYLNNLHETKASRKVSSGDQITIVPVQQEKEVVDNSIYTSIQVIEETPEYIVINKPAGLLVHPTMKGEQVTLANWLVTTYPEVKHVGEHADRPGIVHRLDKEASGLLVVAKTNAMFTDLKSQFQHRTVEKIYTVLVHGQMSKDHDTIDFLIDRGKDGRMVSRPKISGTSLKHIEKEQDGKEAITEFTVKNEFINYSLLEVKIHTGRTHQIRVHMYAYGHPVVGDKLYKNKKLLANRDRELQRLFLHATTLSFVDASGNTKQYTAPLPQELGKFLQLLTSKQRSE